MDSWRVARCAWCVARCAWPMAQGWALCYPPVRYFPRTLPCLTPVCQAEPRVPAWSKRHMFCPRAWHDTKRKTVYRKYTKITTIFFSACFRVTFACIRNHEIAARAFALLTCFLLCLHVISVRDWPPRFEPAVPPTVSRAYAFLPAPSPGATNESKGAPSDRAYSRVANVRASTVSRHQDACLIHALFLVEIKPCPSARCASCGRTATASVKDRSGASLPHAERWPTGDFVAAHATSARNCALRFGNRRGEPPRH